MVGGSNDVLENNKREKVENRRHKELTNDHACDISDEEDDCEKEGTEDVLLFLNPDIWWNRGIAHHCVEDADEDVDDGDKDRSNGDRQYDEEDDGDQIVFLIDILSHTARVTNLQLLSKKSVKQRNAPNKA